MSLRSLFPFKFCSVEADEVRLVFLLTLDVKTVYGVSKRVGGAEK